MKWEAEIITHSGEADEGGVDERGKSRDREHGQHLDGLPPGQTPSSRPPERVDEYQHLLNAKTNEQSVQTPALKQQTGNILQATITVTKRHKLFVK